MPRFKDVRVAAAIALGEIGGSEAAVALERTSIYDHREDVRKAATTALERLNTKAQALAARMQQQGGSMSPGPGQIAGSRPPVPQPPASGQPSLPPASTPSPFRDRTPDASAGPTSPIWRLRKATSTPRRRPRRSPRGPVPPPILDDDPGRGACPDIPRTAPRQPGRSWVAALPCLPSWQGWVRSAFFSSSPTAILAAVGALHFFRPNHLNKCAGSVSALFYHSRPAPLLTTLNMLARMVPAL